MADIGDIYDIKTIAGNLCNVQYLIIYFFIHYAFDI